MTPLAILVLAASVLACALVLALSAYDIRALHEPSGDWWTVFERDFRAYAAKVDQRRGCDPPSAESD